MAFKLYNFYLAKDLPSKLSIDCSGMTINELFDYLSTELGSKVKETAFEDGTLGAHAKVAIDGRQVSDMNTIIPDNSDVVIACIIAGG